MLTEIRDVFEKMNKDRYVIGYDLSKEYVQMSFCRIDGNNPETFSTDESQEQYNIPMALCRNRETGQWVIGEEAICCADEGNGQLITGFLQVAKDGGTMFVDKEEYHAKDLLALFLKRSLGMLPVMDTPEKIANITIALRGADVQMIKMLQSAVGLLKVDAERISFTGYEECVFFYMLYQSEELQNHQILVFDSGDENLWSYRLERNHFVKPGIAVVEAKEYTDFKVKDPRYLSKAEKDNKLLEIATQICENRVFAGVFLIGEGFYDDWCNSSLRFLCRNRRVFKGNNLFSKGACLAAREKVNSSGYEKSIRYFGMDRLKCNIGIQTWTNGKENHIPLIEAGIHWYEAEAEAEVILHETDTVGITVEYINSRQTAVADFVLEGLPVTPNRMTRIKIDIKMVSENGVVLHATDLGFGEIYPSCGKEWTEEMNLQY
ncbi:MAG: hypothetical protein IJZ42_03920 [Lachnospiraceae bacterium]|nr:hypothetical protein [Lachnospiraceae bacterium]